MSSFPVSRPEVELLLRCAGTSRSSQGRIRALIREAIDWDLLLRTAYRHRMGPLLYWHLEPARSEAVPNNVFACLQNHFRANNQQNLFLTGELLRLLSGFRAHGITVVPFKGPVLAASVYGNLAFRECGDLDILVEQRQFSKTKEILVSMGYQPTRSRPTRAQEAARLRSLRGQAFFRDEGKSRVIVELHWEILPEYYAFSLDIESLWERLDHIPLGGDIVPTVSPEDMLLLLCVHGYKHLWEQLRWICDVAELIRAHQDMKWEQVMARARVLGGEHMLLLGLLLANDLLQAPLPEGVQQEICADPTVKAIGKRIEECLFPEADSPGKLYTYVLQLRMREHWIDRIRFCARMALTPSTQDWNVLTLPNLLSPLYYVIRLIRLTTKVIGQSTRILKPFL